MFITCTLPRNTLPLTLTSPKHFAAKHSAYSIRSQFINMYAVACGSGFWSAASWGAPTLLIIVTQRSDDPRCLQHWPRQSMACSNSTQNEARLLLRFLHVLMWHVVQRLLVLAGAGSFPSTTGDAARCVHIWESVLQSLHSMLGLMLLLRTVQAPVLAAGVAVLAVMPRAPARTATTS
jgi:hypothetical protein